MNINVDWALLVAGLGLFMLGMHFLELSLKSLLNQTAVRVMRTATASLWLGILLGIMLTALMQSSSLVGLLVLAFVGAGIMPMRNALGVILGANLGTTITGWIVNWLGFQLELEGLALPLMGCGALMKVWLEDKPKALGMGHLALGLGLLLFGLDAMKTGVEDVSRHADLGFLAGWSPIWFLLLGMGLAAIIQSSSAIVMLVLSALHADLINFTAAAAMVIGADMGTTSTLLLASAAGEAVKRQVAVFHLIYNLFTGLVAFLVILPLAPSLFARLGIGDSLYQLVLFHSSFNLVGIFLALPFLSRLADWLERSIGRDDDNTRYLHKVPVNVPSAALIAIQQESRYLFGLTLQLIAQAYRLRNTVRFADGYELNALNSGYGVFLDYYERLKNLESEIVRYSTEVVRLEPEQHRELEKSLALVRYAIYAAKSIKDVSDDLEPLWQSKAQPAIELRTALAEQVGHLIMLGENWLHDEMSSGMQQEEEKRHRQYMKSVQDSLYKAGPLEEIGFSSLLNIVRETDQCGRELLRLMAIHLVIEALSHENSMPVANNESA